MYHIPVQMPQINNGCRIRDRLPRKPLNLLEKFRKKEKVNELGEGICCEIVAIYWNKKFLGVARLSKRMPNSYQFLKKISFFP